MLFPVWFDTITMVKERGGSTVCFCSQLVFQYWSQDGGRRDKGDSTANGAYAVTADGSSGSLLTPDFVKASCTREQQISLVCFRSVNLEFGFTATIYKHITLAPSIQRKSWIGTMCGAELCCRSSWPITASVSVNNGGALSFHNTQLSVNRFACTSSVLWAEQRDSGYFSIFVFPFSPVQVNGNLKTKDSP